MADAPQARTEAPALGIPLRSPAAEADGAVLVYQPPALFPNLPEIPETSTPEPPPTLAAIEPIVTAASALAAAAQLSEAEARELLALTGWEGIDLEEALRVFCGFRNERFPSGESRCSPGAIGDAGRSLGMAQLNGATWAPYCGIAQDDLMDVVKNLRCARHVFQYDIDRGQPRWYQWSVKP